MGSADVKLFGYHRKVEGGVHFTLLYPKWKADGQLNGCCPQSIAFGDPGEIQQGWFKKS